MHASHVTERAELRESSGFWATTATAYVTAATRQSTVPQPAVTPFSEVARPMITTPANATAQPVTQRARKALLQDHSRQHGDDDRPGVHEHRGGARVHPALGLAQCHVVDPEPEDSEQHEGREVRPCGEGLPAQRHERPEHQAPDHQATERERPGDIWLPASRMPTNAVAQSTTVVTPAAAARSRWRRASGTARMATVSMLIQGQRAGRPAREIRAAARWAYGRGTRIPVTRRASARTTLRAARAWATAGASNWTSWRHTVPFAGSLRSFT